MSTTLSKFFLARIIRDFKKGSILANKEVLEEAFIVNKGRLSIFSTDSYSGSNFEDDSFIHLPEGEIFGDTLILTSIPSPVNCAASEDTEVVVISREQLRDRIEQSDEFVQMLVELLTRRVAFFMKNTKFIRY